MKFVIRAALISIHATRHLKEYTKVCFAAMQHCLKLLPVDESERLDVHDIEVKKRHLTIPKNGRGPNQLDFRPYYDQVVAGVALG